jgi:hypothetical protein
LAGRWAWTVIKPVTIANAANLTEAFQENMRKLL